MFEFEMTHFYRLSKEEILKEMRRGKRGHVKDLIRLGKEMLQPSVFKDYLKIFSKLDPANSEKITAKSFYQALRKQGSRVSEEDVADNFKAISCNGEPAIDFEEFIALQVDYERVYGEDRKLREGFSVLDYNGDGFIELDDLKNWMFENLQSSQLDDEDLRAMIRVATSNRGNKVSFREFEAMMKSHPSRLDNIKQHTIREREPSHIAIDSDIIGRRTTRMTKNKI
ncbi:hypothetical protein ACOME3_000462 [Neoechinorhynchus agilis]